MKIKQTKSLENEITDCKQECKTYFEELLAFAESDKSVESKDFGKFESSLFRQLLKLGKLLTQLYFKKKSKGDFGKDINTEQGKAKIGNRTFSRTITCLFGKIVVERYFYYLGKTGFGALDIYLNLPKHTYSYFLSDISNRLNINRAYNDTSLFIERYYALKLSVSALETITEESSKEYDEFNVNIKDDLELQEGINEIKNVELSTKDIQISALIVPRVETPLTVVSFDGVGVPMIKKEAAKIKARIGKGEKKQKKKEALVGVEYYVKEKRRSAEEIAKRMVYPENEKKEKKCAKEKNIQPQRKKYIASIEKSKREVMSVFYDRNKNKDFSSTPLLCLIDGAKSLIKAFEDVFTGIVNKVMILDIIHVIEYIWLIAYILHKEGSKDAKAYVYKKLLKILKGNVSVYIKELETEFQHNKLTNSQKKVYKKVITYFKNHQLYMQYDDYILKGYPIGTGVIESACSHVVKQRTEITGARWGIVGAESILKLRSINQSNEWDLYWNFYTNKREDSKIIDIKTIRQYKLSA